MMHGRLGVCCRLAFFCKHLMLIFFVQHSAELEARLFEVTLEHLEHNVRSSFLLVG